MVHLFVKADGNKK